MREQDWWYTGLLNLKEQLASPLSENVDADVVVVGGGAAGLSAAGRNKEESSSSGAEYMRRQLYR